MPESDKIHSDKEYSDLGTEEASIKFSSRLVGLLSSMMKVHNKENPKDKVSLSQLKSVYCNAARNYAYAGYSRGEWALARVNLFLRVVKGDKPSVISDYEKTSLGGLTFETKILATVEHDISFDWVPSQNDFTKAKTDIKENKLNYHFSSVGELYLEDYTRISFNID
tara:strand:- start:30 stop:530 length:501 start_codon:yes stop_codon:yes gene_type:complete